MVSGHVRHTDRLLQTRKGEMRIVISDLVNSATCELSGKETECLEVLLSDSKTATPAVVATSEFLKLVRFTKVQEKKSKPAT